MITAIANRTSVILSAVKAAWLTTSDIHAALSVEGFPWAPSTTRDTLHYLASSGKIERRKIGAALQWRTVEVLTAADMNPGPDAPAEYSEAVVAAIKTLAERAGVPLALLAPPSEQRSVDLLEALDEMPQGDLSHVSHEVLKRAIRRAAYDMGKALLDVLSGWIEGAQENHEAYDHRDSDCCKTFYPEDIRRMVNDAARIMGTREPFIEPAP
jgi:hypothetical protein